MRNRSYATIVAIRKKTRGDEHQETMQALGALAFLYLNQRRYEKPSDDSSKFSETTNECSVLAISKEHTVHTWGSLLGPGSLGRN
jgi:hypothetical protein